MRRFRSFSFKDSNLKVASDRFDLVTAHIVETRKQLEKYILAHPQFKDSLEPVKLLKHAPPIAVKMAAASELTGLGPMASVAGALAQAGAEYALQKGAREAVVENGGDIFAISSEILTVGIFAGESPVADGLAFYIEPGELPLALCSSSSKMGHSLSFGDCDVVTVVSKDAALADSCATMVCNQIKTEQDMAAALERAGRIDKIDGVLAVKNGKVALYGNLPRIIRNLDTSLKNKITKDRNN
jgi:ApbE superfamily uncharacterized protein (UPF0280 family)